MLPETTGTIRRVMLLAVAVLVIPGAPTRSETSERHEIIDSTGNIELEAYNKSEEVHRPPMPAVRDTVNVILNARPDPTSKESFLLRILSAYSPDNIREAMRVEGLGQVELEDNDASVAFFHRQPELFRKLVWAFSYWQVLKDIFQKLGPDSSGNIFLGGEKLKLQLSQDNFLDLCTRDRDLAVRLWYITSKSTKPLLMKVEAAFDKIAERETISKKVFQAVEIITQIKYAGQPELGLWSSKYFLLKADDGTLSKQEWVDFQRCSPIAMEGAYAFIEGAFLLHDLTIFFNAAAADETELVRKVKKVVGGNLDECLKAMRDEFEKSHVSGQSIKRTEKLHVLRDFLDSVKDISTRVKYERQESGPPIPWVKYERQADHPTLLDPMNGALEKLVKAAESA